MLNDIVTAYTNAYTNKEEEVFSALLRAMVPDYSIPDGGWGDTGSEEEANKSACAATGGYPVSWWPFLWVLAYLMCASRRDTIVC